MYRIRASVGTFAFLCAFLCALVPAMPARAQASNPSQTEPGVRIPTANGITETSAHLMQRQAVTPARVGERPEHELEGPDRSQLKPNAAALQVSRFPVGLPNASDHSPSIHTPSTSFDGATLTDTGAFPPDSMGTVGPTQYVVAVNGRIRSFTKAGLADGVLNLDPDVFFASVMTPVGGSVVLNFTSDPQVRYDRFSGRWFLSIIVVPCTNAGCTATAANRWLLAVSDAASAGTISGATVWTFYFVTTDPGTNFCDYPSLGIDVNALYFGCNMFSSAGAFVGTNAYVVQKTSALSGGPLVATRFAVGTTTTRTLESLTIEPDGRVAAGQGETAIFIRPGHQFQLVSGLITNFHLPQSSLLMLVSAFAGRDHTLAAYREAVSKRYRFYSYGDAMLIA
jgi:hypothetical protein